MTNKVTYVALQAAIGDLDHDDHDNSCAGSLLPFTTPAVR